MEHQTLEKIIELVTAAEALLPDCDGAPLAMLPSGIDVANLEKHLDAPRAFRGTFTTRSLAAFLDYCEDNRDEGSVLYVDPDAMQAICLFDQGSAGAPGWGRHKGILRLRKTPAWAALLKAEDEYRNQRDLVRFLEDWHTEVAFYAEGGETVEFSAGLAALRRLNISTARQREHHVGDYAERRSAMEEIEVKAGAEAPPAGFRFTCQPYDDLSARVFECRLRVLTDGDKLQLAYRIVRRDALVEDIADEFRRKLSEAPALKGVSAYLGEMAYQK